MSKIYPKNYINNVFKQMFDKDNESNNHLSRIRSIIIFFIFLYRI